MKILLGLKLTFILFYRFFYLIFYNDENVNFAAKTNTAGWQKWQISHTASLALLDSEKFALLQPTSVSTLIALASYEIV